MGNCPEPVGVCCSRGVTAMKHILNHIKHGADWTIHEGSHYAHLAYFGGVFFEGHGFYSMMGGLLLILGVAALFDGEA